MPMTVRRLRRALPVVLVVLGCGGGRGASGAPPGPAATSPTSPASRIISPETSRWSGHIAQGKTLQIHTVSGGIRAMLAAGDLADVVATSSPGSPGSQPVLRVTETADGVDLRAEGPREGGCDDGEARQVGGADLAVHVPGGVRLVGRTVSGSIEVQSLASPIDLRTVSGSVGLQRVAEAQARTVNGGITASFVGTEWKDDLELTTVNGSIDVSLPSSANAALDASTRSGGLRVDFLVGQPIQGHRVSLTLGRGGKELRLRTVSGGIHVGKA
jgi:hypothetical protein